MSVLLEPRMPDDAVFTAFKRWEDAIELRDTMPKESILPFITDRRMNKWLEDNRDILVNNILLPLSSVETEIIETLLQEGGVITQEADANRCLLSLLAMCKFIHSRLLPDGNYAYFIDNEVGLNMLIADIPK